MKLRWFAISVASGLLASCATIVEGTSQDIQLSATPASAACDAYLQGKLIGSYDSRRQTMTVRKSKNNTEIRCAAPGYRDKLVTIVSEASAWGVVGALTLDFGLIDYSTGALNKYPASLQIVMEPIYLAVPPTASASRDVPYIAPTLRPLCPPGVTRPDCHPS